LKYVLRIDYGMKVLFFGYQAL